MIKMNLFSLEGKVALITGASRGIGEAVALAFADAGADVVVASRKLPDCEKVAEAIKAKGRKSLAIACNTGKMDDIKKLVAETKNNFGRIDILVNNAATNPVFGPCINVDEGAWNKIMDVNLKGYFFTATECAKLMMEQKSGIIIFMSSTGGILATPMLGAYSISKAGVLMMAKVMATELAPFNIRVNAIAPGLVKTKFSRALWETEEIYKKVIESTPMQRMAEPSEITGAALYLASDASSFVTGETLVLSGGALMR